MDIHKPKPWRGFREFAKEYLIIVIGVLTALGGEQLVENIHWAHKVHQGERREADELGSIYAMGYERDQVQACVDGRIEQIKAALLASDGPWAPMASLSPEGGVGRRAVLFTPNRIWPNQTWASLVADGTTSHLDANRSRLYAATMAQSVSLNARNDAERLEVAGINLLSNPTVLSRAERNALVERLEVEKDRNQNMAISGRQLMDRLDSLIDANHAKAFAKTELLRNSGTYRVCYQTGQLPPGSPAPAALTDKDRQTLGVPLKGR